MHRCPRQVLRLTGVALAAVLAALLAAGAAPAVAGGGGCQSASISEDEGVRVEVRGLCFEPTVLHVEAGAVVSWVNHDTVPHTVTGANGAWGSYEQFGPKGLEEVSFSFDEPGTYPYWCVLHPSMLGAVVVGGGAPDTSAVEAGAASGGGGLPLPAWTLAAFVAGAALASAGSRIRQLLLRAGVLESEAEPRPSAATRSPGHVIRSAV